MAIIYQAKKAVVVKPAQRLIINALDHLGQGMARLDGRIVFVPGALPGETVQVKLSSQKKNFSKAELQKVLEPSPDRQPAACPHYQQCGGCQLQHAKPEAQLRWKQQAVEQLLSHQLGLAQLPWEAAITGPEFGYRRKARLGVWYQQSKKVFQLGFRQQGDFRIQPLTKCQVLSPVLQPVFSVLLPVLKQLQQGRSITHLDLIDADGVAYVVVRHIAPLPASDKAQLCASWPQARWFGEAETGCFSAWQDSEPDLSYALTSQQLQLSFQPDDFIQVNAAVNQQMVATALDWLSIQPQDRVLDLYCGIGNFSLPLAQQAAEVVGVEGLAAMVERAATNAANNGLSNVQFERADLHLPWPDSGWSLQRFDKILLDPARAGASGAIEQLARLGAGKVLYVSCNPETLARDAGQLLQQGYRLTRLKAVEMFPQTRHLEVMALFEQV
ncbi:23S rRNA (uracil(1939)-C(5))-methyltransferase RlmD [Alkalimonas sp. MEB108]|uniref:23S rRNA (uracil(1939)-C(5))-methyltransferase RlmD n=1 Tax=Alkalimonas cellulosilytica TaxID=3058395 RepID=A0ABU7J359_9GAMM|nr:23S rRNA (uracil(1939)-C(5))-methyltransferase RlmD [Alkalimonas sp. MEB108]MEE2000943.1 23S rRNA (uracil(1939)-C(5))-methyltransferase RlmD [Alkalimonas sp. MEB108]